ncbi:CshA/CshB family fibrillar adhesin-related protein [uncultured Mesonia sp.]|uniref:CshA/CshB family fibrillar adhesin-related protein n=1 Tax=uncultured Mesonia sp. TaxID=399731 RepID=UPI00374ED4ED
MRNPLIFILGFVLLTSNTISAQCYSGNLVTSTFATGGTGSYTNRIIWLTWGAKTIADTYGKSNQILGEGETSYASIPLSANKYFCLQATIENISPPASLKSYIPGNYTGDSMDDLYHIGGPGANNQMVAGLINAQSGTTVTFTVRCQASLDGNPVRIKGLVVADAESLSQTEELKASADGVWNVTELQKNIGAGPYQLEKTMQGGLQQVRFFNGNDNNTAAISILSFNQTAYDTQANNYEVTFNVSVKGAGLTAIALGLLMPELDRGDAPASYGEALHIIDYSEFTSDQIALGTTVDLNTATYNSANEIPKTNRSFIGSVAPDPEANSQYSLDALADDNDGGIADEEDVLPPFLKRFHYINYNYKAGEIFSLQVPYTTIKDSYLQAWIDFNVNGVFEPQEGVMQSLPAGVGSTTLSWTVPPDVKILPTYMRLRLSDNYYGVLTPEATLLKGEVEDHIMYVVKPALVNPHLPTKVKD